uniref:Uncharacterized protein n=1 Tax=Oryza nivara TaxID=4536 RepID=A0A0E0I8F9_ORYNI
MVSTAQPIGKPEATALVVYTDFCFRRHHSSRRFPGGVRVTTTASIHRLACMAVQQRFRPGDSLDHN